MLPVRFVTITVMSELPAGDTHDVIHRGGQVVAVVVPIEEYRQLRQAMQEQQLNEEFDAARASYPPLDGDGGAPALVEVADGEDAVLVARLGEGLLDFLEELRQAGRRDRGDRLAQSGPRQGGMGINGSSSCGYSTVIRARLLTSSSRISRLRLEAESGNPHTRP
jgi:hypothetical protein